MRPTRWVKKVHYCSFRFKFNICFELRAILESKNNTSFTSAFLFTQAISLDNPTSLLTCTTISNSLVFIIQLSLLPLIFVREHLIDHPCKGFHQWIWCLSWILLNALLALHILSRAHSQRVVTYHIHLLQVESCSRFWNGLYPVEWQLFYSVLCKPASHLKTLNELLSLSHLLLIVIHFLVSLLMLFFDSPMAS